jgi:hypothetical protein
MKLRMMSPGRGVLALCLVIGACSSETHVAPGVGDGCQTAGDCGGLTCLGGVTGGGYCTADCASAACPAGATCASTLFPGMQLCVRECTSDASCRAGQQCWLGGCQPACSSDANCGSGATCRPDGRCQGPACSTTPDCPMGLECVAGQCITPMPDAGPMDAAGSIGDGQPCASSTDCASGFCLPADRGGVCAVACTNEDACFLAAYASSCGPAVVNGAMGTYCLPLNASGHGNAQPCASDAECGNSTCVASQCTLACSADAQCIAGQHCTSLSWGGGSFMGCGYDPVTTTETRVIPLGDFTIRAGTGTLDIPFATPPEAVSVTLRAVQTSGDPLDLSFYEVYDAAETRLFSVSDISMYNDPLIRWLPVDTGESIAMLIPNTTTDRYVFHHGRMRFSLLAYPRMTGDTGSVTVHADAVVLVAAGLASGTLNLRIHLVGVGVTAATAASDARVGAFLSRFGGILGMQGISVGTVTYVDINAPALDVIDTADGPTSELAQLFRMSAPTTSNVLNLFLVQQVRAGTGGGFNTLGIAGGIPGPPGVHGTMHSGVVIAFDPGVVGAGTAGGRMAGHVAAHECSHFLGLYHTTENGRPCATGEMPSATNMCAPFGGTDVIGDTTYGDTTNLMNFAIVGSGTNDRLTAGQGFVELRNPLTH